MDNSRIVRDIADGILAIGKDGTVLGMNPAAMTLLGLSHDYTGDKYYALMEADGTDANDAFHQMVLDALSDKERVHRRLLPFFLPDGTQKALEVTSSALHRGESEDAAILLSVSDRTEETRLRAHIEDSSANFVGLLCALCGWNFLYAIWDFAGQPFPASVLSKIMLVALLLPLLLCWRHLHLTPEDMGLRLKGSGRSVLLDAAITVVLLGALCLLKLLLLRVSPGLFPAGLPFFNWKLYPASEYIAYAFSVLMQEILSRGIVHELLRRMMPGRNVEVSSILVSSALFGALHIHLGLVYMLSAALLLGVLGVVYNRQKNIWGLCIVHYCLGFAIGILGFVAY